MSDRARSEDRPLADTPRPRPPRFWAFGAKLDAVSYGHGCGDDDGDQRVFGFKPHRVPPRCIAGAPSGSLQTVNRSRSQSTTFPPSKVKAQKRRCCYLRLFTQRKSFWKKGKFCGLPSQCRIQDSNGVLLLVVLRIYPMLRDCNYKNMRKGHGTGHQLAVQWAPFPPQCVIIGVSYFSLSVSIPQ